jgi:hypothetical protein
VIKFNNCNIASQITCVGDKKYHRISANIYNTPEEYQKLCSGANDQSIMAAQKKK